MRACTYAFHMYNCCASYQHVIMDENFRNYAYILKHTHTPKFLAFLQTSKCLLHTIWVSSMQQASVLWCANRSPAQNALFSARPLSLQCIARSLIGTQILVRKINPLVPVTVAVHISWWSSTFLLHRVRCSCFGWREELRVMCGDVLRNLIHSHAL